MPVFFFNEIVLFLNYMFACAVKGRIQVPTEDKSIRSPPQLELWGGARNSPTWIRGDKLWSLQEPSTLLALRVVTDLKMRFTQCDNTQHILTS